jgi:hypothetical protein
MWDNSDAGDDGRDVSTAVLIGQYVTIQESEVRSQNPEEKKYGLPVTC